MDNFFDNAEVTKTFKAGALGTKKVSKQTEFHGKLLRIRYYKNKKTGLNKKTYEIDPDLNDTPINNDNIESSK
jgi:hypothetical protein